MGSTGMCVRFLPNRESHMLTQRQIVTLKLEVETEMGQNRTYYHLDTAVNSSNNLDDGYRIKDRKPCYQYHVDLIHCLEYLPQYQVVYVHDPDHHNSGFYYCHHIEHGVLHLIECVRKNFGPILFEFSGQFFTKFELALQELQNDHVISKLAYEDYKKDLETQSRFNLNYTEYLEVIVDELIDKCKMSLTVHMTGT